AGLVLLAAGMTGCGHEKTVAAAGQPAGLSPPSPSYGPAIVPADLHHGEIPGHHNGEVAEHHDGEGAEHYDHEAAHPPEDEPRPPRRRTRGGMTAMKRPTTTPAMTATSMPRWSGCSPVKPAR